jgi:hypothetical protein
MYFAIPKGKFWKKSKVSIYWQLPVSFDRCESIFDLENLREFDAKIEKPLKVMEGAYAEPSYTK